MPTDIDQTNFNQATADLNLNQQEQNLYQMHLKNLWSDGGYTHPTGDMRSTLFQSVEEHNGSYYNIPTVWGGKIETEAWTRPSDNTVHQVPNAVALANVDKAGWENFPKYNDPDTADARYGQMHGYMEKDTGDWFAVNHPPDLTK